MEVQPITLVYCFKREKNTLKLQHSFPKKREQFEVWKQFSSIHLILHDNKGDAIAFVLSSYSRLRKTSTSGS